MTSGDWHAWHSAYDDPGSWQAKRLTTVRERIGIALNGAPPGPVTVLALVAGEGRDLLPVLAGHPRRHDVTAVLVELDPRNADAARAAARDLGLPGVRVITGDAALTDHYLGVAPADLVLICGLFAHITDDDIITVIEHTASFTKRGGSVVWTRHRREPDLVPRISAWFTARSFAEVWVSDPAVEFAVGVHRHLADPPPVTPGVKMFTFVGVQALRPWESPDATSMRRPRRYRGDADRDAVPTEPTGRAVRLPAVAARGMDEVPDGSGLGDRHGGGGASGSAGRPARRGQ